MDTVPEYLNMFAQEGQKGFSPEDLDLDRIRVVVHRTYPVGPNGAERVATFSPYELEDKDIADVLEGIFGGGGYQVRLTESGNWRKGSQAVTVKLAGDAIPHDQAQLNLMAFRGQTPPPEKEEKPEKEDHIPNPWDMGGAPVDPFGRYIEMPVRQSDGSTAVVQVTEKFLATLGAFQKKEEGSKSEVAAVLELIKPVLTAAVSPKETATEKMQLQQFQALSDIQGKAMANVFTMNAQAQDAMFKAQAEVMKSSLRLITDLVRDAKDEGGILDRLPDLVGRLFEPMSVRPSGIQETLAGGPPAPPQIGAPAIPTPEGSPAEGAPGDPAADPEAAQLKAYSLHAARQWIGALRFGVQAQPDVDMFWEQSMMPGVNALQGVVRQRLEEAMEALPPDSTPGDVANAFASVLLQHVEGLQEQEFVDVVAAAAKTPKAQEKNDQGELVELQVTTGQRWLSDFWAANPWVGDDDDFEDEEEDLDVGPEPPITKEPQAPPPPKTGDDNPDAGG